MRAGHQVYLIARVRIKKYKPKAWSLSYRLRSFVKMLSEVKQSCLKIYSNT